MTFGAQILLGSGERQPRLVRILLIGTQLVGDDPEPVGRAGLQVAEGETVVCEEHAAGGEPIGRLRGVVAQVVALLFQREAEAERAGRAVVEVRAGTLLVVAPVEDCQAGQQFEHRDGYFAGQFGAALGGEVVGGRDGRDLHVQFDRDRAFFGRRSAQGEGNRSVARLHFVSRERFDGDAFGSRAFERCRDVGLIAGLRFLVGDRHPLVHELLVEVETGGDLGRADGEESVLLRNPDDQFFQSVGERDAAGTLRAVVLRDGDVHRLFFRRAVPLPGRTADPRVVGRDFPGPVGQDEQLLRRIEVRERERVVAPLQEVGFVVLAGCAEGDRRQAQKRNYSVYFHKIGFLIVSGKRLSRPSRDSAAAGWG